MAFARPRTTASKARGTRLGRRRSCQGKVSQAHRPTLISLLGLQGLVLLGVAGCVPTARAGEITATTGAQGLGTIVNDGTSCTSGLCAVTGGTVAGPNLFHRFNTVDTRGGAITGVSIDNTTSGASNVFVGVLSPTFINQPVGLTSLGSLTWLSPAGISLQGSGGFTNVNNLNLSTATSARIGGGVFDALNSTASQVAGLNGALVQGKSGLFTDQQALNSLAPVLTTNGDISISGGLLTVERSLLLDAQKGNISMDTATVSSPQSLGLIGERVAIKNSTLGAANPLGLGGNIQIEGNLISLQGAVIDASGADGGGKIFIGGGQFGRDPAIRNSQWTSINPFTTVKSDALYSGSGGLVVAYASQQLNLNGSLSSKGGPQGGAGGLIETSAPTIFFGESLNISTASAFGGKGLWWIDPTDITIQNVPIQSVNFGGFTDAPTQFSTPIQSVNSSAPNAGNIIPASFLQSLLGNSSTDVLVSTSGFGNPATPSIDLSAGTNPGDITVRDSIAWSSASRLFLNADRDINLLANIAASGVGGGVVFSASSGTINVGPAVTISTAGDQIYNGNIQIPANHILTAETLAGGTGGIGFFGKIDGQGSLQINPGTESTRIVFNKPVGSLTPLDTLTIGSIENQKGRTYINADITTSGNQSYFNNTYVAVRGVGAFTNSGFDAAPFSFSGTYSGLESNANIAPLSIDGWDIYLSPIVFGNTISSIRSKIDGFDVPVDLRNVLDVGAGARSTVGQGNPITTPACFDNCGGSYTFTAGSSAVLGDSNPSPGNTQSIVLSSSVDCNSGFCITNGPYIVSKGTVFLSQGDTVQFKWTAAGGADDYNVNAFLLDPISGVTIPLLNSTGGSIPLAYSDGTITTVVTGYSGNLAAPGPGQWGIYGDTATGWIKSSVTLGPNDPSGSYKFVYASGSYDGTGGQAVGASMNIDSITVSSAQPTTSLFSNYPLPSSVKLSATGVGSEIRFAKNLENSAALFLQSGGLIDVSNLSGAGTLDASSSAIKISGGQLGTSSVPLQLSNAQNIELTSASDIYARHIGNLSNAALESTGAGAIRLDVQGDLTLDGSKNSITKAGSVKSPGGSINLIASGAYLQNSTVIDASTADLSAPGGSINLDASSIFINGVQGLSGYSLNTSGGTTGGDITIGSLRAASVSISGAKLFADPPAVGGNIQILGGNISASNTIFNVNGLSGGSILIGNGNTSSINIQNSSFSGGGGAAFALTASSIFTSGLSFVGGSLSQFGSQNVSPLVFANPFVAIYQGAVDVLSLNPLSASQTPDWSVGNLTIPLQVVFSPQFQPPLAISLQESNFLYSGVMAMDLVTPDGSLRNTAVPSAPVSTTKTALPAELIGTGTVTLQKPRLKFGDVRDGRTEPVTPDNTARQSALSSAPASSTKTSLPTELNGSTTTALQNSVLQSGQPQAGRSAIDSGSISNGKVTSLSSNEASSRFTQDEQRAQTETAGKLGLKAPSGPPPTPAQIQGVLQRVMASFGGPRSSSSAPTSSSNR